MRRAGVLLILVLAGCGGAAQPAARQPHLPRALAQSLRAQADGVAAALAAGDGCLAQQRATALQSDVIAAVNARRLSPRFQETLLGSVNDLLSRIACVPPPPPPAPHEHGHGKHDKHGKHGEGD